MSVEQAVIDPARDPELGPALMPQSYWARHWQKLVAAALWLGLIAGGLWWMRANDLTPSEAVLTGPNGILAGLKKGSTWIENSTLGRDETLRLAAVAKEHGIDTLEAPDFELPDFDGRMHRLSDYRGQKVFLSTWASW